MRSCFQRSAGKGSKRDLLFPKFILLLILLSFTKETVFALEFFRLGAISVGGWSTPFSVNANGSVVVGYSDNRAFRWSDSTGMQNLGLVSSLDSQSGAHGVSANGEVVVGFSNDNSGSAGSTKSFMWSQSGGMQVLDSYNFLGTPMGISGDGNVVCGTGGGRGGARWTATTGTQTLNEGIPSSGGVANFQFAFPTAISSDGNFLVGGGSLSGTKRAYRWSMSGGTQLLPSTSLLVPHTAKGVSADGSVSVGYGIDNNGRETAFRWDQAGGLLSLGTLGTESHMMGSIANSVSGDGLAVVGESANQAFIWSAANGMQSLQTILTNQGIDLSGWNLSTATAISLDGSTIVGSASKSIRTGTGKQGITTTYTEAFVVTGIPEPSSLSLLALGGVVVALGRRKK